MLNGTIADKGILAPLNAKINGPLMKELKEKYGYVHPLSRSRPLFLGKGRALTERCQYRVSGEDYCVEMEREDVD